ncbi:GntR family transcriptional regulator [Bailinhaonella thermotolerans]|uniref:GntR family transcriptional regulator n=1 Tax=Bailinhaonella thermotolerans TaxID=1070861 RepID=A0A3A4AHY6_9ACTN|nr:GntR family transcriptional regulator [Bailinhaonella thermotolerans]RJL26594.1 GntR family transcriptional regulator [Bailinhaonella thermotolerans]
MARSTLYEQLASELRQAIYSGELGPGAQLPTESDLMYTHKVSRNTVRLALRELETEGLVSRAPRRGTIVRDRRPLRMRPQDELAGLAPGAPRREAFLTAVEGEGRRLSQQIEVHIVVPPEEVASRLRLNEGDSAMVRRRLRLVDGQPYNTADSYFPLDIVRDSAIAHPPDIMQGANRVLEALGHPQKRFVDDIWARMPTPEESQRLQLEPGTPVVVFVRTGYDPHDVPVRVAVSVLPADKHTIRYELER